MDIGYLRHAIVRCKGLYLLFIWLFIKVFHYLMMLLTPSMLIISREALMVNLCI